MAKAVLKAGMEIDGFRLEERVHIGGMAALWRVTRPDIDMPMLMKVPFLDFEGDISMLVGFEVEQMIFAEVTGPHVPKFVANGDFTVQPYIVMERVTGDTLLKRMANGPLPIDEVVSIGARLARAVASLHEQHVLHLDLKPANIIIRDTGEICLIDFGLSRHEQLPDLLEEQFHAPTGTAEYISPEQLLNVRAERRSDIFAVGAIMYEMLTGTPPYPPGTLKKARQRFWKPPDPPRALRAEIPPWLQEVVLACLEAVPTDRPKFASELQFELTHPELVVVGERGNRMARSGFTENLSRRMKAGRMRTAVLAAATAEPPRPPLIVVAVDLRPHLEALREHLLDAAASALANAPGARLGCIHVLETSLVKMDENVDAGGENIHVRIMGDLRRWAAPLQLPRASATFHLLESIDVASAILDFTRSNHAAALIIGIPTSGEIRPGSLPHRIREEAPCPVTLVKAV